MSMLHEEIGMRIGLTLTDQTLPSKAQVKSYLQQGLHRLQIMLDPSDIWGLSYQLEQPYNNSTGITNADFAQAEASGYAQIISVLADYSGTGPFVRCTEIPPKDWDKAENPNSMYYGQEDSPVFSAQNQALKIFPAPTNVKVNYIGTIDVDPNATIIPNVPQYVQTASIAYATAQAAQMLAAHYAQEEDPISQQMMAIAQTNMNEFNETFQGLMRKSKIRGNIS